MTCDRCLFAKCHQWKNYWPGNTKSKWILGSGFEWFGLQIVRTEGQSCYPLAKGVLKWMHGIISRNRNTLALSTKWIIYGFIYDPGKSGSDLFPWGFSPSVAANVGGGDVRQLQYLPIPLFSLSMIHRNDFHNCWLLLNKPNWLLTEIRLTKPPVVDLDGLCC